MFSKKEIIKGCEIVYKTMPPTPQIAWPLLQKEIGTEVWVKHENHTPIGAFKVRGGLTFMDWLNQCQHSSRGVVTATRGNHGQSIARAASKFGKVCKVYVPKNNSHEKNKAMKAFGAELIEYGIDFDMAKEEAQRVAKDENLTFVPSFHQELVRGVATCAWELFIEVNDLHTVYVPIGCGSGVCGMIAVRDALQLKTRIVGVVSERAQCAKLSVERGSFISTNEAETFADGVAVRVPVQEALDHYAKGVERIVSASESEIMLAIQCIFRTTHNVAEGAGAIGLAGLIRERAQLQGKKVGFILSGGNIDMEKFRQVLSGEVPMFN
ncbi:MAG: threonine dehydratase [Rhodobacteraceae bacterium]|nr:threonine dehydratase [Paracoccaceae bacterium]